LPDELTALSYAPQLNFDVRTLRHQSEGTEMSWVWSVLGPKCLDTSVG